jgi:glycosyltransferase involved in cell wall biosynthesis
VLPPGVDLEWFSDDGGARDDYLLFVGRIKWWKNIELAIAGVSEAHRRGSAPALVIAGAVDPFEEDYVETLRAKSQGLPVRFEIAPTPERIRELYRGCRALVFPTPNEDFGIVPLEAMACGAPVIAVDSGGPRETILPGVTGWLVPPTAEAFATAMVEAGGSGGMAEGMRSASRSRAMEFSWDRFASRIDEVMEEVASNDP